MDTDGVNFSLPDDVETRTYIGRGLNWKVKEGKEFTGPEADVAEYNDTFMRGEMALDCDGTWPSCINLARKNYATMDYKGKIKLTGNSIKSKKLPLYIEEFLDVGIRLLLEGKGKDFVEYYYEYLQKIYDKQIPLSKIAQRARVKLSIDEYKKTAQCELINGYPLGEGDQDNLEEVMTPSDNELSYWEKRGLSSDYMYELAEEGWEEKLGIFETVTT
jgi:DNA polymerase elongation subunit (family B)